MARDSLSHGSDRPRVEYRVVAVDVEDGEPFEWTEYEGEDREIASKAYAELSSDAIPFDEVRFQRRTITTSPWRAVRRDSAALRESQKDA